MSGGGGSMAQAIRLEERLREDGADIIAQLSAKYIAQNKKGEAICQACDMILRDGSPEAIRAHFAFQHTLEIQKIVDKRI